MSSKIKMLLAGWFIIQRIHSLQCRSD